MSAEDKIPQNTSSQKICWHSDSTKSPDVWIPRNWIFPLTCLGNEKSTSISHTSLYTFRSKNATFLYNHNFALQAKTCCKQLKPRGKKIILNLESVAKLLPWAYPPFMIKRYFLPISLWVSLRQYRIGTKHTILFLQAYFCHDFKSGKQSTCRTLHQRKDDIYVTLQMLQDFPLPLQ